MGNTPSGSAAADLHSARLSKTNPTIISAFNSLSNGASTISYDQFKEKFYEPLAIALWRHLHDSAPNEKEAMSLEDFSGHCRSLMGMSTDTYIQFLMPARNLLNVCFQCASVSVQPSDKTFIDSLIGEMVCELQTKQHGGLPLPSAKALIIGATLQTSNGGDKAESVIAWKNSTCPSLCQCVQQRVMEVFHIQSSTKTDSAPSSIILSPVQMFILQKCLPTTVYFPEPNSVAFYQPSSDSGGEWILLYSSAEQGISVIRFETNVFGYKGSTVCIFKLTDGRIYAIASDQEWRAKLRHSMKRFGGPSTTLFQLHPKFMRVDACGSTTIYCNFKNRSAAYGINFGCHLSIDGEFTNVTEVEAWGCAGVDTLEEHKKQKMWQKSQAQKHSTVVLDGTVQQLPFTMVHEKRFTLRFLETGTRIRTRRFWKWQA